MNKNLLKVQMTTALQELGYRFLQKQIEPYIFPELLMNKLSSISIEDNMFVDNHFYQKIRTFINVLEVIRDANEPLEFFCTGESVEKGKSYFPEMQLEVIKFMKYLYGSVSIPLNTKNKSFEWPFLLEVKLCSKNFLEHNLTLSKLKELIFIDYGYWKNELSKDTATIIQFFLSTLDILPFILDEDKKESSIREEVNKLIVYIEVGNS